LLVLLERTTDWARLKRKSASQTLIVASNDADIHAATVEAGLKSILLEMPESSIQNQLTQAMNFDSEEIDTISVLKLTERLGRLTARDLKKLETKVPLDTLKMVVDLAVEIGRDGREGKPIGTMFVVGDHRKVLEDSRPAGFDMVKGYNRKDRNMSDGRVREGVKELAQLDGCFVVSALCGCRDQQEYKSYRGRREPVQRYRAYFPKR